MKIGVVGVVLCCVLSVTVVCLAYFTWQYPVVGDLWSPADGFRSFAQVLSTYARQYGHGNPRIGQFFVPLVGWNSILDAAYSVTTTVALAAVSVFVSRISLRNWPLYLTIFLACLFFASPVSGVMIAYLPYNANYVFGIGLLLIFLSFYATSLWRPLTSRWLAVGMIPLGFAAGMTNEMTVPYAIALVVAYCAWRWRDARLWSLSGAAALIVGYVALFFAPGEGVRYGGVKYREFHLGVAALLSHARVVLHLFLADAWPFLIVAIILFITAVRLLGPRHPRVVIGGAALLGAFGMSAPLIVSPLLGARMVFGSDVSLCLAITTLLPAVRLQRLEQGAALASAIALAVFLRQGHLLISSYHNDFVAWRALLEEQRAQGVRNAVEPDYELRIAPNQRFIAHTNRRDNPKLYPNPYIARYFGFRTFRFEDQPSASQPRPLT